MSKEGFQSPEVYVDSYVALNGRLGKPLIDPIQILQNNTIHLAISHGC